MCRGASNGVPRIVINKRLRMIWVIDQTFFNNSLLCDSYYLKFSIYNEIKLFLFTIYHKIVLFTWYLLVVSRLFRIKFINIVFI